MAEGDAPFRGVLGSVADMSRNLDGGDSLDGLAASDGEDARLVGAGYRPAPSAQLRQAPFAARSASSRSFASRMFAALTARRSSTATP